VTRGLCYISKEESFGKFLAREPDPYYEPLLCFILGSIDLVKTKLLGMKSDLMIACDGFLL